MMDKRGGSKMIQAVEIAPGINTSFPELRYHIYDSRKDEGLKNKPTLTAARTKRMAAT